MLTHHDHFGRPSKHFLFTQTTFSRKQNFKKARQKKMIKIKEYLSTNQLLFKV